MKDWEIAQQRRREAVEAFNAGPRAQVLAEHAHDLTSVRGLRKRLLEWHAPYMEYEYGYNRPVCPECSCSGMGCMGGYVFWPCDHYKLARDWSA